MDGTANHGVIQAVALRDPDGNDLNFNRDRATEERMRLIEGNLRMCSATLVPGELPKSSPKKDRA